MPKNNVQSAYNEWSQTYDADENPTRDLDKFIVQNLIYVKDKIVLEAGCGTGKNTVWLAEHAQHIMAFDFSSAMMNIAHAKVTSGNVEFKQHDITRPWPYSDAIADIVLINLVLEHIENIYPVIQQAYRVLNEHGLLLVCELHPAKTLKGTKARFQTANGLVEIASYYHAKEEFISAGKQAGFNCIQTRDWNDERDGELPQILSVLYSKNYQETPGL